MTIIYYTNKDGKIVHHNLVPKKVTREALNIEIQKFNGRKECGRIAHVFDTPDDGLTAYLLNKAAERRKWDEDVVQDAINDIENALETVRGLL